MLFISAFLTYYRLDCESVISDSDRSRYEQYLRKEPPLLLRQQLEVLADEVLKGPQDHLHARLAHFAWATQLVTLDFYVSSRREVAAGSQSDVTEEEQNVQRLAEANSGPLHQSEAPPPGYSIQHIPEIPDGLRSSPVHQSVDPNLLVGLTSEEPEAWSAAPIRSMDPHSSYSPSPSHDEFMSLMSQHD